MQMRRGQVFFFLIAMGLLTAVPLVGRAGTQIGTSQQPSSIPGIGGAPRRNAAGTTDTAPDPLKDKMEASRAKMFETDRHKKLVADTDKLLQLATELKSEMDKSTKDELSIGVIKKAADIEKLAHDVKERMKG